MKENARHMWLVYRGAGVCKDYMEKYASCCNKIDPSVRLANRIRKGDEFY